MRKTGVSARNGRVRLKGESRNAFIYKIIDAISRGKERAKAV